MLRGACRHWPVTRLEGPDLLTFLLRFASARLAEVFVGEGENAGRYRYTGDLRHFNFKRETIGLADAFRRISEAAGDPDAPTVYAGSLPTDSYFPGFAEAHPMPLVASSVTPRVWIGNASGIACHYDAFDNLACCVAGRRRFTLYPPAAIGDLYVGPVDHTMAGQPVALAADAALDDARYPRVARAHALAVGATLMPGDAVYIPKLWWHQVDAEGTVNCLVNYWWDAFSAGPDAPMTAMMLAMITMAERPAQERAAWRAWFDHYVFRPQGHPLAHLPSEQHGVLGPLAGGNYGRIRAWVLQMLRGR
ncbi:hypothetical protein FHS96_003615 [Sphingomonas zeicaulis]